VGVICKGGRGRIDESGEKRSIGKFKKTKNSRTGLKKKKETTHSRPHTKHTNEEYLRSWVKKTKKKKKKKTNKKKKRRPKKGVRWTGNRIGEERINGIN